MKKPKTPPDLNEFLLMLRQTKDESDRGIALIMTAWLDDALEQFLKARIIQDAKVIESLFGLDRPLGTFSAQINAAYVFGFIGKERLSDLHTIRDIRNLFAHNRGNVS